MTTVAREPAQAAQPRTAGPVLVRSAVTRVRSRGDGRLTAQCLLCDVVLEQARRSDPAADLAALDAAHPCTPGARHTGRVPAGWRVPLSAPGAWSQ